MLEEGDEKNFTNTNNLLNPFPGTTLNSLSDIAPLNRPRNHVSNPIQQKLSPFFIGYLFAGLGTGLCMGLAVIHGRYDYALNAFQFLTTTVLAKSIYDIRFNRKNALNELEANLVTSAFGTALGFVTAVSHNDRTPSSLF